MSRSARSFIMATAGHVDHGKSSLVRILTGTDPDRSPEEKTRGLTIQLGFASLELQIGGDPERVARLGVVDVPGHEDFVKNMVAGVGSIDLALLVVAADDGWMPQTEEHLHILQYLGVRRGVVALTKADLAPNIPPAAEEVRQRLRETSLAAAPIIPTSIHDEGSHDTLRDALSQALAGCDAPRNTGKPRLPLDRVFSLPGVGTVVTGTLTGGSLEQGQAVVVKPTGAMARIRSIQSHGQPVQAANPGSRVALHLAGVRPNGPGKPMDGTVRRGDTVTQVGSGCLTSTLDVSLWRLEDKMAASAAGHRPPALRNGVRVHIHHGTASTAARIYLANEQELLPGRRCLAQIRLERPAFVLGGDHLVVRDWSGRHTLAGGLILDPEADRRDWKRPARVAGLNERAASPQCPDVWVCTELLRLGVVARKSLLKSTNLSAQEIEAAVARLIDVGTLTPSGDFLFCTAHWKSVSRLAAEEIDLFHRNHPERLGLLLTDLRATLGKHVPKAACDAVVDTLCGAAFRRTGASICRADHIPRLPKRLAPAGERLRRKLQEDPLNPPSRLQLAPDSVSEQALRFLIINGEVRELGSGCVIAESAVDWAAAQVRGFITTHGPASVSHLKQHLRSSRRTMVPLLEHLDRIGVTRREGDRRILGEP